MLFANEKQEQIVLEILIAIALLGSVVLSTAISNGSLLPLIGYLLLCAIMKKKKSISIRDINPRLLFWYGICFISCAWGLATKFMYDKDFPDYTYNLNNYIIKLLIFFIPLWYLFTVYENRDVLERSLYRAIAISARIMMIWALAQLVLWDVLAFNLNNAVFGTLINPSAEWTTWLGEAEKSAIRISGLNPDPAFLGFFLLLGTIFDKNKLFKAAYVLTIFLSMSRTAIVGLAGIAGYLVIRALVHRKHFSRKTLEKVAIIVIVLVVAGVAGYMASAGVRLKVSNLLYRFDFLSGMQNASVSSMQHIMYIPYAFKAGVIADPIQALIGVGARMSGVFITSNPLEFSLLPRIYDIGGVGWTIECDLAEVLIGTGYIGAIAYYGYCLYLFRMGDLKTKYCMVMLAVTGLMYTYAHQTITFILFITLFLVMRNQKDGAKTKNEVRNSNTELQRQQYNSQLA